MDESFANIVYVATAVVGAFWIACWLFIVLRRRASNLTSASSAPVQKDAAPDFLKVDHAKRDAAIKAGEAYGKELTAREAAEAAAAGAKAVPKEIGLAERFSRIASALFAVFSLAVTITGALNQAKGLEGAGNQFVDIATKHPMAMIIAAFVIAFHIYNFVTKKKWNEAPR
jgi:hypothetical protein